MATALSAQDRSEAHPSPINGSTTQQGPRDEGTPAVGPVTAPAQHSGAPPPHTDTSTRTSTEPDARTGSPADSNARLTQNGTTQRPGTGKSAHLRFNLSNTSQEHLNSDPTDEHLNKPLQKIRKMLALIGEP